MKYFFFTLFFHFTLLLFANTAPNFVLECPRDTTLSCGADISNLDKFGRARYKDHYGWHDAGSPHVSYHLNGSCGGGYIIRTWRVEDPTWKWEVCSQRINIGIGGNGSFNPNDIIWPVKDTMVFGCNPNIDPEVLGKPKFEQKGCTMIAVNKKDETYVVNAHCKKIIRTWKLLDWCQYEHGNNVTYTYTQIIKVINNDIPKLTCPADVTIETHDCNTAHVTLSSPVVDPSTCGGVFTVTNNSPYSSQKGADASGVYPIGVTVFNYHIQYGCGQSVVCTRKVTVVGRKSATPICISELVVALMGKDTDKDGRNDEGEITIWAKDLNYKSQINCPNSGPLSFSFAPDTIIMNKTFTCDQIGVNKVRMYVHDRLKNVSFCEVKVEVQNNGANIINCNRRTEAENTDTVTRFSFAGKFFQPNGLALSDISLGIYSKEDLAINASVDTIVEHTIDSFVNYAGALVYRHYFDTIFKVTYDTTFLENSLKPLLNGNNWTTNSAALRGNEYLFYPTAKTSTPVINWSDWDVINSHLSGRKELEPWQKLAADINQDGRIDQSDADALGSYLENGENSLNVGKIIYALDNKLQLSANLNLKNANYNHSRVDIVVLNLGDVIKFQPIYGGFGGFGFERPDEISNIGNDAVYPNPTMDQLNFDLFSEGNEKIQIYLIDGQGKIIRTLESSDASQGVKHFEMDVLDLSSGIYQYKIVSGDKVKFGRVFKI